MKKFLTEPLVHFLILGALIFAAWGWLNRDVPDQDQIVVSRSQQQHLVNIFERTWQRAPTPEEREGLVRDYIREEIAYREGQALGLADNDTVIRRRVRQKLELWADEMVSLQEPTSAQLQAFLEANEAQFALPLQLSFRHVYFNPQRGESVEADALEALAALQSGEVEDWRALGDPLPMDATFDGVSENELDRRFGTGFAGQLEGLPSGAWAGPVASGFGLHLVFVEDRVASGRPTLALVEQQVKNEWHAEQRSRAIESLYLRLAEKYQVIVEPVGEPGSAQ